MVWVEFGLLPGLAVLMILGLLDVELKVEKLTKLLVTPPVGHKGVDEAIERIAVRSLNTPGDPYGVLGQQARITRRALEYSEVEGVLELGRRGISPLPAENGALLKMLAELSVHFRRLAETPAEDKV